MVAVVNVGRTGVMEGEIGGEGEGEVEDASPKILQL
tara:strand:+ start:773 stop:880 length:108 start_codon:yes stop_codon:yes gene_type:complete